jgi:adenylate kinase family enzyme
MKRVLVIGAGGSGKTTFARRLAERTGLPLIHLDQHYWSAGWVPTADEDWRAEVDRMVARDCWIMDGNYGGTFDIRMPRSDTVLFLDVPRIVCLWRVAWRRLWYRGRGRPDLPPGCPERLTWEFITWIWSYPRRRRDDILQRLAAIAGAGDKRVVILSSAKSVDGFLAGIRQAGTPEAGVSQSICD